MSQTTTTPIPSAPNVVTGSEVVDAVNALRASVLSNHAGAAQPSYIVANMTWVDTDTSIMYFYDGATDHEIGRVSGGKFVALNATNATNVYQDNDPAAGTYRLLLGNSTDANGAVYNFSGYYVNSTSNTIVGLRAGIEGQTTSISLAGHGDFTAGTLYITKVGRSVTIHMVGVVHSAAWNPTSDAILAAEYRPIGDHQTCYYYDTGNGRNLIVYTDGRIRYTYFDTSGSFTATTPGGDVSTSFISAS